MLTGHKSLHTNQKSPKPSNLPAVNGHLTAFSRSPFQIAHRDGPDGIVLQIGQGSGLGPDIFTRHVRRQKGRDHVGEDALGTGRLGGTFRYDALAFRQKHVADDKAILTVTLFVKVLGELKITARRMIETFHHPAGSAFLQLIEILVENIIETRFGCLKHLFR